MKLYNQMQNHKTFNNEKLEKIANFSYNLKDIPPIIGVIIGDQFGNTIQVLEYENKPEEPYGCIKSYLSEGNKNLFAIDLISMYFSSFKTFAGQTNIQDLSNLEIHGSNIKVQLYFLFEKYMIILFLNSKVDLNLKEKGYLIQYFKNLLTKYEFEFQYFNAASSRKTLKMLEDKGKLWLKKLNKKFIQSSQNYYLKKHEFLDLIIRRISPGIEEVLSDYLKRIPEDIINDMSRELKNKIHDKISEFNFTLE